MKNQLLSEEGRRAIAEKIGEVEKATAGEIVVHVVPRSSAYGALRIGYATLLAYLVVQAVAWALPEEDAVFVISGFPLLFGTAWGCLHFRSLFGRLIPGSLKQVEVHRRAVEAFVENRVHRTRDASGVLILVSALEKRVEILADEGIHQRVGVEGWTKHIDVIVRSFQSGKIAEGLVEAIGRIGEDLSAHFPPRPDDTNELPDEVIVTPR
jgi:putative membrane protein